ncbi:hypothetical protein AB0F88_40125 [Streptosporangium sp. NPDC023963]|uniref:hypothetical protein n=1 Tax=Streptosporangium sp. NPDC023963 TaxID=3155608 RepID=UPI00341918E7
MGFAASLREGIAGPIRETWYRATGRVELAEQVRAERMMVDHLSESLADLQARMSEPGWQRMTALAEQEFTREGLQQISSVCRIMAIKNPLLRRGLSLRTSYVWGQGVSVSARATGEQEQDVNDVIQKFLNDPSNRRTLTGDQAHEELERGLFTDGNVFLALFTRPTTGRVQARTLPWDEITDVVCNPEDRSEPWFYRREWWQDRRTGTGIVQERKIAYYPALGYNPALKPRRLSFPTYGDTVLAEVMWDAPVYHVRVNSQLGWKFGIPDAYAAVDWAQAYREFLTDWAKLIKSLSRFAWKLTSRGSKQAAARTRLAAAPATDRYSGEPQHAGATALMTPDMMLEAVPKSGASIDSESGRPLAAMVAAALDVPVTMLLGDPGTTGARATAETLDTPTERSMELRRSVWGEAMRQILDYVIDQAVKAPQGSLDGAVIRDEDGREIVELAQDTDRTLDVSFPDIDDLDPSAVIEAIVKADGTGYMPPLVIVRLLLEALGVRDADSILETLTGERGEFVPPEGAAKGTGQAAVDAFRRGEDPAALLAGEPPTEDLDNEELELEPAEA